MWSGGECWIIGGGSSMPYQFDVPEETIKAVISTELKPSAYSSYLSAIHDKHIMGINNAYELGAWIDICFFGDCTWYLVHRMRLAGFPGIKVTCCPRWSAQKPGTDGLKFLQKDSTHRQGITSNPTKVSWNANSGASAISLARHLGVKRIILLGFDMARGQNNAAHWHNSHGNARKPPPFKKHMEGWPMIAGDAKEMGIEIINASPDSKIKEFQKVSVKELLNGG